MDFALHVQGRADGGTAIAVRGDLDYATTARFLECIDRTLQQSPATLYIDLRLTTFLDSGGIAAHVTAHKGAARAGIRLIVEHPMSAIHRVLHLTGLTNLLGLPPL
ncbi:STAS domain-containing protein [Dactylosporangium roseum]|uniref:STAS domain-containing protein n=1 Tax=Dactylosporangium roseum TaxID=47989 RepID=A0ABY5ZDF2_9ACTN|nr:STAS domain-containing protein [Dactylosporangium roseum]UWZ39694.1 STAS domain-containing protein [Dactylosporangium roseum]